MHGARLLMAATLLNYLLALLGARPAASTPAAEYAGAKRTRSNQHWNPRVRSANQEIRGDNATLHARALSLARDEPLCDNCRQTIVDEVVGTGILSHADARGPNGESLTEFDLAVDDFLENWEGECDLTDERDWTGMCGENLSDTIVQGNSFLVESYDPDPFRVSPVRYELIEPHQLDRTRDNWSGWMSKAGGGNLIMNGIEYDRLGRPVTYYIVRNRQEQLGWGFSQGDPIPAARVIHHFRRERSGQKWGVTWFRKIIAKVFSKDQYIDHEIDAAQNAAKLIAFFQSDVADSMGLKLDDSGSIVDKNGNPFEGLAPSTFMTGTTTEKLTVMGNPRPSSTGDVFIRALDRLMGLGMHMSYYRVAGDSAGLTYSNLRAENAKDDTYFDPVREWQIRRVDRPARTRVLTEALAMGRIKGPGVPSPSEFLAEPRRFLRAEYIAGTTQFIDRQKEVAGSIAAVQGCLSTFQFELAQQRRYWRQVFRQQAEEREYAKQLGLPVELIFNPGTKQAITTDDVDVIGQPAKTVAEELAKELADA